MDGAEMVEDLAKVLGASLRAQAFVYDSPATQTGKLLVGGAVSPRALAEAVLAAGYLKPGGGGGGGDVPAGDEAAAGAGT